MTPAQFVQALSQMEFDNVFNPYSKHCEVHDLENAPYLRSEALCGVLGRASSVDVDSLWIGRDLGYRGGRRTGLALTDDIHAHVHAMRWNVKIERATRGQPVAERTAAVIWGVLELIAVPVFLWNVFPLHPHEPGDPFTNRSHNSTERQAGEELLSELIHLLNPRKLVALGNDAAKTASALAGKREVVTVRHPSHGGQGLFVRQMHSLYGIQRPMSQGAIKQSALSL
ncbi:MAG: uracil-DNA glycosylase [Rhodospirillales bacterium]